MTRRLLPLCLLALSACSGATPLNEPDAAAVDVAVSEVAISAAIASASLANDCPSPDAGSAGIAEPCARPAGDAGGSSDSACGGSCRQTSLQLTFTVTAVGSPLPITPVNAVSITSVRLIDSATSAVLDTLTPRDPQRWEGSQYASWDRNLRGFGEARTSFKLSAPNWVRIGSGNSRSTYGRRFRLEVTVVVGGQTLTLRSGELMRSPEVAT